MIEVTGRSASGDDFAAVVAWAIPISLGSRCRSVAGIVSDNDESSKIVAIESLGNLFFWVNAQKTETHPN